MQPSVHTLHNLINVLYNIYDNNLMYVCVCFWASFCVGNKKIMTIYIQPIKSAK